jgi:lipid-binding SYLF domain-containing protein
MNRFLEHAPMKSPRPHLLSAVLAALALHPAQAGLWDKAKSIGEGVADTAGKVVDTAKDAVSEGPSPAEARREIDRMAEAALNKLFGRSPEARRQFEEAAGYAVFDTRKFSFMITTGFGAGVAVDKATGERTYMKMATGGVNIGAGVKYFQVVFLFPDKATFRQFVENGWSADTDASALGGKEGIGGGLRLANGVLVYEVSDTGVALSASLAGTKYWKDDKLNAR